MADVAVCVRCGTEHPFTREFFAVSKGKPIRRCRACDRKRVLAWRNEHLDECRAADRARWREKKSDVEWREQRYARRRSYYETHREELLAANRKWREENGEQHRANARRWAAENRPRCAANNKAWRERNRHLARAHSKAQHARQRDRSGVISSADVAAQYDRQRGRCYWCGERVDGTYHVDHVIPLAKGGDTGPHNIVIACAGCNLSKGAKHPMDFAGVMF